ncbi:LysR family transcriptional regulator [Defluviimonas sp. WL0002]|uniref:LysR family transcriptional regulator n=1 Tax=Albidovulum marisflavi TaxID=2984159 RepID=A0ABT2ZF12_9RHOB|nr:LysR family transcriptional regulator [Defluviimonas sp. WL0002]MCV2869628.1 LysR family transcriptional regulator [Defluviimonas sp. WL0002]
MSRPPPPLNFIRSFECAARHLSFTKAAEELGYTQAAISTHIRALEKYVGRDLFVRNARSIELTEMGEAFLPTLRQGLALIDTATDAIATTSRDRSVVIACPMSLAENWLPECLAPFHADHPDVDLVINGTVWESDEDPIADLVISVHRDDAVPSGAHMLWPETLSLVCAPALAAALARPGGFSEIPKILVAGRQEYWSIFAQAMGLTSQEIDTPFKTNSSNISLELAAQGFGATVALSSLCRTYLVRGLLAEPLPHRPPSPWSYFIANRRAQRGSVAARVLDHILGYASVQPSPPGGG